MPDTFAENTARLKNLLERIKNEIDPVEYDQLAAEIRRVLDERENMKKSSAPDT